MDEVKTNIVPEVKDEKDTKASDSKVPDTRTPEQKLQDYIKEYSFIKFTNNRFILDHGELQDILVPKILTMGDLSARGRILSGHNGGAAVSAIDPDTLTLNSFLALIQVGFENFKLDLTKVVDSNLIDALYLAVKGYNAFFRKAPLGMLV